MADETNDLPDDASDDIGLFRDSTGYSTGYLVRRAHRAFTRALELRLDAHDVNISMWFFLRLLWAHDGKTQKELSDDLALSQPTTVSAIDNLEKRGFVQRRRNVEDRRKTNIYLTPEGKALEKELAPYARQVNETGLETLTERERKTANQLLLRMIDSLNVDIARLNAKRSGRASN